MQVRAKTLCFVDGFRRRAGSEFDYEGTPVPSFLEVIEPVSTETQVEEKVVRKRSKAHDVTTSDEEVI